MILPMTIRRARWLLAVLMTLSISSVIQAGAGPKTPVELGDVPWIRDLDVATAKARQSDRPILLLFQEVPG